MGILSGMIPEITAILNQRMLNNKTEESNSRSDIVKMCSNTRLNDSKDSENNSH